MRNVVLILSLAVALAGPLFAKSSAPPDISGTWLLNLNKSKLAKNADIHSETLVIECSGSTITMRDNVDGKLSVRTYFVDGKERPFAEVRGGEDLIKEAGTSQLWWLKPWRD